jgi:hypothetical protein
MGQLRPEANKSKQKVLKAGAQKNKTGRKQEKQQHKKGNFLSFARENRKSQKKKQQWKGTSRARSTGDLGGRWRAFG